MVATRHAAMQQQHDLATNDEETDAMGRKIMRMPARPGSARKTQTPSEAIDNLWKNANDKMRQDWLTLYAAILSSGGDQTADELADIADQAYFEFHARCNPSKFNPHG